MKVFFISLIVFSTSSLFAKEAICEKSNQANYLTFETFDLGIIPLKNEHNTKYLEQIKNKLVPTLKELCASGKSSEKIVEEMHKECIKTVKSLVKNDDIFGYFSSCELAELVAKSYVSGARVQASKCEDANTISNLGRQGKEITDRFERTNKAPSKSIAK